MTDPKDSDKPCAAERPDEGRGSHNRLGYLNVDETDASSERGAEEPEVADELEQPE
jgi:hypothetical protein